MGFSPSLLFLAWRKRRWEGKGGSVVGVQKEAGWLCWCQRKSGGEREDHGASSEHAPLEHAPLVPAASTLHSNGSTTKRSKKKRKGMGQVGLEERKGRWAAGGREKRERKLGQREEEAQCEGGEGFFFYFENPLLLFFKLF
jgi:hypothetical protein